ncbi:MAG: PilZ domain-containing protein [Candidatus Aureabacteria bacterium]|nr:PilZ domain-containing protein [Candidatus Auribacterota bacterium]
MAFGGINRRRSKRFNLKTVIILEKETSSLNPIRGNTRDLSMGGASCLIPVPIKVFTIVNLRISVSGEEEILDISGRVTWVREIEDKDNELNRSVEQIHERPNVFIIGIQFLNLYSKKKEMLKSFLKNYDSR